MSEDNPYTNGRYLTDESYILEKRVEPSTIKFNCNHDTIMTIHPDGKITLGEHADPTEAAAKCIEAMGHMIQNMIDIAVRAECERIADWLNKHHYRQIADAILAGEHLG